MKIEIFDVGHGACTLITCPNGKRIMIDCGYNLDTPWFPSITFKDEFIDLLVLNNLDEDHVDDLPDMWRDVQLGAIYSNPGVSAAALAQMKKEHGMDDGVKTAHAILDHFGPGMIGNRPDLGEVLIWDYVNHYGLPFTDTNNLSPAVFVRYKGFTILFAGDLETKGWESMLRNPGFKRDLATVRVIVASHHGRLSGQCEEAFKVCKPEIVVFSDCAKKYETQNTDAWYRNRVIGVPVLDAPFDRVKGHPKRHVLTTRRDGTLTFEVNSIGGYLVRTERETRSDTLSELLEQMAAQSNPSLLTV